ncbi:MAG: hypothetical protein AAF732_17980, partial [Pseudomonadota bacterium]
MSNGSGDRGKNQKVPKRMIDLKATEVRTDRSPASPKPSGEPSKPVPPKSSSVPKAGKTDAGKRTPAAAPTGTAAAIAAAKPGAAS